MCLISSRSKLAHVFPPPEMVSTLPHLPTSHVHLLSLVVLVPTSLSSITSHILSFILDMRKILLRNELFFLSHTKKILCMMEQKGGGVFFFEKLEVENSWGGKGVCKEK